MRFRYQWVSIHIPLGISPGFTGILALFDLWSIHDNGTRVVFPTWRVNAYLSGASAIVLGFTLFELVFGVLQFLPVTAVAQAVRVHQVAT